MNIGGLLLQDNADEGDLLESRTTRMVLSVHASVGI